MRAVLEIRKEPVYRREAFERGLQRVGFTIGALSTPQDSSDWLILWNRKKGADEARANAWEALGGTVIVAENGYFARVDKTYYAISVHGHNGSGWFPVGDEDRFAKLGAVVKPWRPLGEKGREVLVRDQRGIGSALMASPPNWGRKTVAQINLWVGGKRVTLMSHPGDKNKHALDAAALKNADQCVIWSSAIGVRALVEGIPVWYAAPHWICEESAAPFKNFAVSKRDDEARARALHRMSFGQWHFDEIATGEPFARIIANREKASW
jgi:hypothetical protein